MICVSLSVEITVVVEHRGTSVPLAPSSPSRQELVGAICVVSVLVLEWVCLAEAFGQVYVPLQRVVTTWQNLDRKEQSYEANRSDHPFGHRHTAVAHL
jgi:hypothetical protein